MVLARTTNARAKPGNAGAGPIALLTDDDHLREIVAAALVRSFTSAQVDADASAGAHPLRCAVWVNPPDDAHGAIERLLASGGKALVLGAVGPRVAAALGLEYRGPLDLPAEWAACAARHDSHHDASPAEIRYDDTHPLARASALATRPLLRYDFAEEWNNLGFGRISLAQDCWSLATAAQIGEATMLARLVTPAHDRLVYAALRETASGAALWFNRPVGPVDSVEWSVVESFLGDYRGDDLPCHPYVSEIPAGFRGAVCARLDCDEAVASCRPLLELYRDRGLPLSLALLTGQSLDVADLSLLGESIAAGGSVVSHSHTHAPNWGGCYQQACVEADVSRAWIHEHLPQAAPVRYAVSPFHQNPPYAVAALADSGYEGFLGGIIANDPEYLLGRAGRVPLAPRPIVSHSAQCMLHGDCYRRYGNSVDVYRECFDQHLAARAVFGYLDHPFSARYQYGWSDEDQRLDAHRQLIEHIGNRSDIWWASINGLLDFLRRRDAVDVIVEPDGSVAVDDARAAPGLPLTICWKGREIVA